MHLAPGTCTSSKITPTDSTPLWGRESDGGEKGWGGGRERE